MFDPATGKWSQTNTTMKHKGSGLAMVNCNGTLVTTGGFDGQHVFEHVEMCKQGGDWQDAAPMQTARFAHCSVAIDVAEGESRIKRDAFTAAGGTDADFDRYAQDKRQMQVWAIGGTNGNDCLRSVEILDLTEGCWYSGPSMLHKRFGASAVVVGQYLYMLGGFDGATTHSGTQVTHCFYYTHPLHQHTVLCCAHLPLH